ncbi:MAG: imelysin family protein [Paracoccaceae bacterium]|nr:MAG: imelysin family protein [Paracoccaceae bacterium]
MRWSALFAAILLSTPAGADVDAAMDGFILPGFRSFAGAAAVLAAEARDDCRAVALRPAFHLAFDAWMAVADLRIGPSEAGALSVAFWPDDRGFTQRTLSRLVTAEDPAVLDPAAYAEVSIAGRGLLALDMLLHDPAFAGFDLESYGCALVRAIATDLAQQAAALDAAWTEEFAPMLSSAGQPGNPLFLTRDEAVRAIYTQVLSSLEFTAEQRLGRPMGTFERPRPRLAEAWRAGRSLRNVVLAVEAAQALARGLAGRDLPATDAAARRVHALAAAIADPGFQDMDSPQARLRVEALQQAVRAMRAAVAEEIGARLGIAGGFNAQDGD